MPRTGNHYVGILASYVDFSYNDLDYREYVAIKLSESLDIGTRYFVSFHVSLGDSVNYTTDKIGALFQVDSLYYDTPDFIPLIPQIENPSGNFFTDKVNWTLVTGTFIADSAYQHILIGNFNSGSNTPRQLVPGGGNSMPLEYDWTYFYLDDICVSTDSLACHQPLAIKESDDLKINIYPNPSEDEVTIELSEPSMINLQVISIQGKLVLSKKHDTSMSLDVSGLPSGVYLIKFFFKEIPIMKRLVVN